MNFSTPDNVASVIENLKDAEIRRAPNRALIHSLFNGESPYTQAEAEENKIQWNVNWGEGADILLQGREQLENAHLSSDIAFTVRLPDAPPSKQSSYGGDITRIANRLLRKSRPYFHTQRSKWGGVILHGTGAQYWYDCYVWRPQFISISDLLLPTDTELPLENLNHFAIRRRLTPGQLFRKTLGKPEDKRDPGWKIDKVKKVLDQYKDVNQNMNTWNWFEHPEKMAELWKQNAMYYESDAVPVVWMWDFYFQDDESAQPCWYRKILLDNDCIPGRYGNTEDPVVYLYDSEKPHAERLDQILHIQFLDGNNVPPFMYHSCRGLGMRLHDAVQALNRLRCQFIQKVFEDMMLLFRAADPIDRSRLDKIYLGMNYGIIPDGLTFVTRDQRYSPDPKLIEMQLANLKQLIGEGSSQYTQDIDTGTNKERTAFEVSTLLNQTTRLTGSMLNLSYIQEGFAYEEICRRLTLKNTPDWEAKRFQNDLKEAGIPEKWIDSSRWEIEPVRVLGNGNLQQEQAQAQALLNVRPMLNPEAQNEVMHDYIFSLTHDPKRANRLAPLDGQPKVTDTVHDTELAYGSMMSGSIVTPKPGLVPAEVCATMLRCMATTVQMIMHTDGMGTPQQVQGLQQAAQYTSAFIGQLAQDQTQKQQARQFADALKNVMNMVKAMAQRQQQKMAANGNGMDPEGQQKLQLNAALAQQKLQANAMSQRQKLIARGMSDRQKLAAREMQARQKMMHQQSQFMSDQQLAHMETLGDVHNDAMQAAVEAQQTAQEPPEPSE